MNILQLSTVLVVLFSQNAFTRCQRRMGKQNAIMTALQNIMGPQNLEKSMQMMFMKNRRPPVIEEVVPIMPNWVPREIAAPNMRVIEPKYPCQLEGAYPLLGEFIPKNVASLPTVPNIPAPIVPVAQMPVCRQTAPEIVPLPLTYPVRRTIQEGGCACPCSSCSSATPLISPFLPAASPVSPWAPPTSNLLPPVIPSQTRPHFLRKIPIPPPTL